MTRDSSDGIWYGVHHPVAPISARLPLLGGCGGVGDGAQASPSPTTKPSVMPRSYAIIFVLRPISTWEQCKLFKTRFSGLAIIIMMISISVAIASDYLAGNFAAWGRGSSREMTCMVRSEGMERERKRQRERVSGLLINKPQDWRYLPLNPARGRFINWPNWSVLAMKWMMPGSTV